MHKRKPELDETQKMGEDTPLSGKDDIDSLRVENWQLKAALGYAVPDAIPEGDFKCGLCEARRQEDAEVKSAAAESNEMPYWEGYAEGHEMGMKTPLGARALLASAPPPPGTYHQITIIENTNDKEWMHRNMDLSEMGKRIDKLVSGLAMFAVGVIAMVAMIWILA